MTKDAVFIDQKLYWLRSHLEGAGYELVPKVDQTDNQIVRLIMDSSFDTYKDEPFLLSRFLILRPNTSRKKLPSGLLVLEGTPKDAHSPSFKIWFSHLLVILRILYREFECESRLNSYIADSFQNIIDSQILANQKEEIEKLNKELSLLSSTDYLTGLFNRRAFFEILAQEKKRAREFYQKVDGASPGAASTTPTFACLMMDIDHFKQINDTHGHLVGDQVLKRIGEILTSRQIFRDRDIVARYGGEEIVAVIPEADEKKAQVPAEKFRETLSKIVFKTLDGNPFVVTISIGITEFTLDEDDDRVIARADKALYTAKKNGRNQSVLYSEIPSQNY